MAKEIAYDLYGGTYVEGNWTEEEEAEKQRLEEARRLRDRISYDYDFVSIGMFAALEEFYKAVEKATLDLMLYGRSPVMVIHDSVYIVDEVPTGRFSGLKSITDWDYPIAKSIYIQPAREKFRSRALQANQPGDQPWKKRK